MTYESEVAAQRQRVAEGEQRFLEDLFAVPAARRSDPDTSHEAAASMAEEAGHQRAAILAALADAPACNDELDARLGYRVGTASRRTAELLRMGLIERSDTTRPTRTGRAACVLRVAGADGQVAA